jgi:hypothetical protein
MFYFVWVVGFRESLPEGVEGFAELAHEGLVGFPFFLRKIFLVIGRSGLK